MLTKSVVSVVSQSSAAPAIFTREQVKAQIAEMKSSAVHALSSASTVAARESFVTTCCAIAVQRAVFGSDEIYQSIQKKARALSDYKTNKAGGIVGKLGKLLHGYGEALSVGKSLAGQFPMHKDECDLSAFANSPTFGALILAPKAETPKAETPKAETPKAETPKPLTVDQKWRATTGAARDTGRAMLAAMHRRAELRAELAESNKRAELAEQQARIAAEKLASMESAAPAFGNDYPAAAHDYIARHGAESARALIKALIAELDGAALAAPAPKKRARAGK